MDNKRTAIFGEVRQSDTSCGIVRTFRIAREIGEMSLVIKLHQETSLKVISQKEPQKYLLVVNDNALCKRAAYRRIQVSFCRELKLVMGRLYAGTGPVSRQEVPVGPQETSTSVTNSIYKTG